MATNETQAAECVGGPADGEKVVPGPCGPGIYGFDLLHAETGALLGCYRLRCGSDPPVMDWLEHPSEVATPAPEKDDVRND